jgi:predicted transcriptional regulator
MNKFQAMSDSEQEIMKIIWSNGGSILFTPLLETLANQKKDWKKTTVQTFLMRLIEKNILTYQKSGRKSEYIALLSEDDYRLEQTKAFLNKTYGGNAKNLVSSLLKQDYLTHDDFEELKQFWNGGKEVK